MTRAPVSKDGSGRGPGGRSSPSTSRKSSDVERGGQGEGDQKEVRLDRDMRTNVRPRSRTGFCVPKEEELDQARLQSHKWKRP